MRNRRKITFRKRVQFKMRRIREYFRYRLGYKYHMVPTGLEPDYYDIDTRMLHANFELLKEYVEVELAWRHFCFVVKRSWKEKLLYSFISYRRYRNSEYGLAHLNHSPSKPEPPASLGDPFYEDYLRELEWHNYHRSIDQEIEDLYLWWTKTRPNRPEPMDESGWSDWCDFLRDKRNGDLFNLIPQHDEEGKVLSYLMSDDDLSEEEKQKQRTIMDKSRKLEKEQEDEDEEMLIRLIKIRQHLWT
jgi:hypothetical protein